MSNQMTPHEWVDLSGARIVEAALGQEAGILELIAAAAIEEGLEPGDDDHGELKLIAARLAEVMAELAATAWSAPERIALEEIANGEADPAGALYTALVGIGAWRGRQPGGRIALSVYLTPAEWARLQADPGPSSMSRRVVEAIDRDRRVARLLHLLAAASALEPGCALERMRQIYGLSGPEPEALPC